MILSAEEPEWVVSFKKALVATIKVQLGIEAICKNVHLDPDTFMSGHELGLKVTGRGVRGKGV